MKLRFLALSIPIILTATILCAAVFNDIKVSPTSKTPIDSSALFEVASTTKGILFPRMTSAQRTAISSPADGLMVFDTETDTIMVYIASTTSWEYLVAGAAGLTANRAVYTNGSGLLAASTVTSVELGYLSGVTSGIQTQLNAKEPTVSLTANRVVVSNGSGGLAASTTNTTALGYIANLTSDAQTQITAKLTNPLTTKGDILVYSTSAGRLPVITDNFVLTADSTQTLGVKWASSSAGSATVTELGYTVFPGVVNCQWSATSNATWADFAADSDCTLPTGSNIVGTSLSAPATKIPGFVIGSAAVSSASSTYYYATVTGNLLTLSGAGSACSARLFNGTDASTTVPIWGSDGVADDGQNGTATFIFHLTSAASTTMSLQMTGVTTNNTCVIKNNTATFENLTFSVRKATVN